MCVCVCECVCVRACERLPYFQAGFGPRRGGHFSSPDARAGSLCVGPGLLWWTGDPPPPLSDSTSASAENLTHTHTHTVQLYSLTYTVLLTWARMLEPSSPFFSSSCLFLSCTFCSSPILEVSLRWLSLRAVSVWVLDSLEAQHTHTFEPAIGYSSGR